MEEGSRYFSQKSVLAKMALALEKALEREEISERSAWTSSAPREESFWAAEDVGFRVTQRTCQFGRVRKVCATEEP